jgi:hypothetical protein
MFEKGFVMTRNWLRAALVSFVAALAPAAAEAQTLVLKGASVYASP